MKRILLLCLVFIPSMALASSSSSLLNLHMPYSPPAILALITFIIAYLFVMTEEFTHLRKSKPVVISAGIIWIIIALICNSKGVPTQAEETVRHNILEYAELFFFLLVGVVVLVLPSFVLLLLVASSAAAAAFILASMEDLEVGLL